MTRVHYGNISRSRGSQPTGGPDPTPPTADGPNGVAHDAAGLLSVRRGGGSFEFTLTPRPNARLDAENLVIGQVLGGMEVLERINTLPTNNYDRAPLATVKLDTVAVL